MQKIKSVCMAIIVASSSLLLNGQDQNEAKLFEGRPMVYPTNTTIAAVYGQPLTLQMEFCANPTYNRVFWIAKDQVIRPGETISNIMAYKITNSSSMHCHQAVLYLSSATDSDIGEYSFIVRSQNGIAEGVFTINMTYASGFITKPATDSSSSTLCADLFVLLSLIIVVID